MPVSGDLVHHRLALLGRALPGAGGRTGARAQERRQCHHRYRARPRLVPAAGAALRAGARHLPVPAGGRGGRRRRGHVMRADLAIIAELINPGARVLDLGCGTGELLAYLQAQRQVNGYGLEIDADNITACLANGVNVLEQNLDEGLYNFQDDSFDMVVMTETLQAVREPEAMLDEMLRIGRECVVTFPNF